MSDGFKTDAAALGVVTRVLAAQAYALDRLFYRAATEAFSFEKASRYHARKALTAQARCRATFKILLALREAAPKRPSREGGKEFPDLIERTIQTLETTSIANSLARPEPSALPPAPVRRPNHRTLERSNRWSEERRARQAAAIRTWQPWRKSTGPRTTGGKQRSAANALKHGQRSKAYIQLRRDDRLLLIESAANLAVVKLLLGLSVARNHGFLPPMLASHQIPTSPNVGSSNRRSTQTRSGSGGGIASAASDGPGRHPHSIGIGRVRLALIPFAGKFSGNRGLSGLSPADNAVPRRRWRIAS